MPGQANESISSKISDKISTISSPLKMRSKSRQKIIDQDGNPTSNSKMIRQHSFKYDPEAGINICADIFTDSDYPGYKKPDCEGWLEQYTQYKNKGRIKKIFFSQWSWRYIVIHNGSLYAYKFEDDKFAKSYVYLCNCDITVESENINKEKYLKKHVIKISEKINCHRSENILNLAGIISNQIKHTNANKEIILTFVDIEQRRQWLETLNHAKYQVSGGQKSSASSVLSGLVLRQSDRISAEPSITVKNSVSLDEGIVSGDSVCTKVCKKEDKDSDIGIATCISKKNERKKLMSANEITGFKNSELRKSDTHIDKKNKKERKEVTKEYLLAQRNTVMVPPAMADMTNSSESFSKSFSKSGSRYTQGGSRHRIKRVDSRVKHRKSFKNSVRSLAI